MYTVELTDDEIDSLLYVHEIAAKYFGADYDQIVEGKDAVCKILRARLEHKKAQQIADQIVNDIQNKEAHGHRLGV